MKMQVIKSAEQHEASLVEIDRLIMLNPGASTDDADRLAVLAVLVEKYEKDRFPIEAPTPVEAIHFRMEQQGLTPRDLEVYVGSKSKVSEILAEKIPLSLRMIRALHEGLGIPAEVLLQPKRTEPPTSSDPDWSRFPILEMWKRGWLDATRKQLKETPEKLLQGFFAGLEHGHAVPALLRRTLNKRAGASVDEYALAAWAARVQILGAQQDGVSVFHPDHLTKDLLTEIGRHSSRQNGPVAVKKFLATAGISLVVEPHLPRTKLDGAAMMTDSGRPVIGLTLRHDRIDSFWFTLLHELAHLMLHIKSADDTFIDDLDIEDSDDSREREADRAAGEALIPRAVWRRSSAFRERTVAAISELAVGLSIHPAIVAGRLRKETRNYRMFSQLVGHRQVRVLFTGEETNE